MQMQTLASKPNFKWIFNLFILSLPGFKEYAANNLRDFLEIIENGEVSHSILWEPLKVTMTGLIVSFESSGKKTKKEKTGRD